ncbi:MAG TPA: MgtC/SapB family protein [Steroidobacteraceae bacterium]|nr:MgtC/SapB family protein [Steroidobacteraceae bacterium]
MADLEVSIGGLGVALGIGFLVGVDRERHKGSGPSRGPAGLRTFVLVAMLGAAGELVGGVNGLLLAVAVATVLAAVAYWRGSEDDPGLTTEIALVLTCLLGGIAQLRPVLAAALGTLVALLLASRSWLHSFVRERLSEREIMDGFLLAGAGLVVLPILPDRAIDPYGVINPRVIWTLALIVMLVNAAGYVALRTLGPTAGLALSGLAGGFVSSSATIGTMGSRSRDHAELLRPAVAGAALSSVATVVELAIIISVTNAQLLKPLWPALIGAGVAAVVYGAAFSYHAARARKPAEAPKGRAFELRTPLIFAAAITLISFVAAFLTSRYGSSGGVLSIALAGFADTHSAAASAANLARTGSLSIGAGALAVLIAFATNTLTKAVVAWISGGPAFALRVIPGVLLMLAAAGAGAVLGGGLVPR